VRLEQDQRARAPGQNRPSAAHRACLRRAARGPARRQDKNVRERTREADEATARQALARGVALASPLRRQPHSLPGHDLPMKTDAMTIVMHVSRYLRSHPDACDTPAGIARWWLDLDTPVAVVDEALGLMSAAGVVEPMPAADGRVRYRRRPSAEPLDARLERLERDPRTVLADGGGAG
jgi:hypothetical protein